MPIYHAKTVTIADDPLVVASGGVVPSDYNAAHIIAIDGTTIHTHNNKTALDNYAVSNFVAASLSTNFQPIGSYLTTAMQSDAGSNFVQATNSTLFQATSATSNITSLAYPTANTTVFLTTGMASNAGTNFMSTSERANYVPTANSSLLQATSATSNITLNAFPSSNSSNLVAVSRSTEWGTGNIANTFFQTSNSSLLFPAANTTKFAGTGTTITGGGMTLNSNGLALSINGGGGGVAASIGGNSTSAGAGYSNVSSGTVVFMGGNNITLSQNGASVTISGANVGGAQTGISGIAGSGTFTQTSGTVQFQNSNNITFGITNGVMTASFSDVSNSNYVLTANSSLLQATSATSNITSNAFNTSGSSNFVLTANSSLFQHTSATSNITSNAFAVSNSSLLQALSATSNITSNAFPAANSTNLAGSSVSSRVVGIAGFNASTASGVVQFNNSNGITFGLNGNTITASHNGYTGTTAGFLTSQSVQTQNSILINGGSGAFTLAGTGTSATNASITLNSNGLAISVANPGGGGGAALQGSGTYTQNTGTVQFANGNGVTFGLTNGVMTASITPSGGAQTGISTIAGGGTTFTSGGATIIGSGAVQITNDGTNMAISAPVQSVQTQGMVSINGSTGALTGIQLSSAAMQTGERVNYVPIANSTQYATSVLSATFAQTNALTTQTIQTQNSVLINGSSGQISINPAAGLTFTTNASTMTVGIVTNYSTNWTNITSNAFPTVNSSNLIAVSRSTEWATSVLSNTFFVGSQTTKFAGIGTSATNASITLNSNGLAISVAAPGGGGGAAIQGSGTYSQNTGTVQFANSNGVTFGLSNNGVMTASISPGAAAGIAAIGNSQTTFTNGTVSIHEGGGAVTVASDANGFNISVPVQSVLSAVTNCTIGTTGSTIGISVAAGGGGALTWGLYGNTSGTTVSSQTDNNLYLKAGNNVTLSGSSNSIVVQAEGVAWSLQGNSTGTGSSNLSAGSIYFSAGPNITIGGNSNTIVISGNASMAAGVQGTMNRFWNPIDAMQSVTSSGQTNASASIVEMIVPANIQFTRLDIPVSMSMATSGATNVAGVRFSNVAVIYYRSGATLNPIVGVSNTQVFSWASNTGSYSSVTGGRLLSFNIGSTLTPGEYYVGLHISSTSGISTGAGTTALNATMSMILQSVYTVIPFTDFNAVTASSTNYRFQGLISSALTNTTQTLQLSQMTMTGANLGRAQVPMLFRNN